MSNHTQVARINEQSLFIVSIYLRTCRKPYLPDPATEQPNVSHQPNTRVLSSLPPFSTFNAGSHRQRIKTCFAGSIFCCGITSPRRYAKEFVLVGGTALLYLGSTRTIGDVDFLITAQSLNAFEAAAKNGSRFSKDSMKQWHYTSSAIGITIAFEFLAGGGGFVSASKDPQPTSLQA